MCIGIWTLEHPEYALILGTNRDEFLNRPTVNAHFHAFGSEPSSDGSDPILSGRDERAGGSWFGINRAGRVTLLTNITEPINHYNTSRGSLVSSFLLSNSSHPLEDEIGKIVPKDAKFAGFNLLLLVPSLLSSSSSSSSTSSQPDADGSMLIKYDPLFLTNHGGGGELTSRSLTPSECTCGGMSNGVDGAGAASWPKVKHATEDLQTILQAESLKTETELVDKIFELLTWHPPFPINQRSDLRQTIQVQPVPIALELSDANANAPTIETTPIYYGTRLSTILLVSRKGEVLFIERDIWQLEDDHQGGGSTKPVKKTDPPTERRFRFQLDVKPSVA